MKTIPKLDGQRMTGPDTSSPAADGCTCGQANMVTHEAMCEYCWQRLATPAQPAAVVNQRLIS